MALSVAGLSIKSQQTRDGESVYTSSVHGMPMTRIASWSMYRDMLEDAEQSGGLQGRKAVEAWLGRNDLFYLIARLLRRPDIDNDWLFARCREVERDPDDHLDLWSRGHYKDLACDTLVLTDNRGWVMHGDLQVGDMVFAPSGKPVAVLAVTKHYTDSKCYRVTFRDGHDIVCGAGHLWSLRRKISNRIPGTDQRIKRFVREEYTTAQLVVSPMKRMDVGVAEPLQFTDVNMHFIDPYVLGCWLGDGTSEGGGFTSADAEIVNEIRARGYDVKQHAYNNGYAHTIYNIRDILRGYRVLNNKHIPRLFMHASVSVRMDLLRGLMDTDGHIHDDGTATFVNTNEKLINNTYELAQSLGLRPRKRRHTQQVNGLPYVFYHVSFAARADRNPFLLSRKANKVRGASHYADCRYIASIESVESVPTNCIQVEGGMYNAGIAHIPTHNSTIITFALTIQEIIRDPNLTIGIFSHAKHIAKGFLRQIKREFEENDLLKIVYDDVLWANPEKDAPQWNEDGIIVRRTSNPKEATIEAWGLVDGQPTSKHYGLRVYDDVVTVESVSTADQIQKTTEAWELSLNLKTTDGRERYIGTRYALYDTYSVMMARNAVTPRLYPATHNGRMDGTPVFLTQKAWDDIKRKRSRASIAAQQLQNPQADEGAMFMPDWLRSYDVRPLTLNVYIMCDPSRGRSADSDNTAIAVVGVATNGSKYLLDGACHRMQLSERWRRLSHLYDKWSRMRGVRTVKVGYERYGAQSDDEYFQERMRQDRRFFDIKELNWTRDGSVSKKERVERLEPDFRNSRFYLPLPIMKDGVPHFWSVDTDRDSSTHGEVLYTTMRERGGLTANQRRLVENGSPDLLAKTIKLVDSEGKSYDLTKHFFDEYLSFPFGRYKDLIDAASRIYDMEPIAPRLVTAAMTEPTQYIDR